MTIKHLIGVGALALAVTACTPNDTGLGSAARANYAAQTVEPDPVYEGPMVANGNQTAGAQERYRKGTVKKPASIKTTTKSGGGSGGNN